MNAATILIVEDEGLVAEEIALRLTQLGHNPGAIVDNAQDAFEYVRAVKPDMALVDINIKGPLNGIDIARRFRTEFDVPVIFMTAHADAATLKEATAAEPFGYVVKPFDTRALAAALETGLRRRHAEQKLAKMERWLAATMMSIGDGVIATDGEFRIAFINPAAQRMCGVGEGEALGRPVSDVYRISGPRCGDLAETIREAAIEGVVVGLEECELETTGGSRLPIDDTLAPIRDADGRVTGVVIVFRDATQRRLHEDLQRRIHADLEERVQRRTAQLQAANEELAAFAYSIAHDLRAPLRAIIGFATRVVDEHSSALEPEGRRLLEVVTSRATQMSRMIDDYLRLSRLSHASLSRQQLDMTQLAREAWDLVTADVKSAPEFSLNALPPAYGDQELILQVWVNLLANAVKFTRTTPGARVRVSGATDDRCVRYQIEDNGVGFDPAYGAKLFHLFERLHSQSEFEGNGVGLCIVQRALHRHEGDIAISAQKGRGARVEFWLPRRARAAEPLRAASAAPDR